MRLFNAIPAFSFGLAQRERKSHYIHPPVTEENVPLHHIGIRWSIVRAVAAVSIGWYVVCTMGGGGVRESMSTCRVGDRLTTAASVVCTPWHQQRARVITSRHPRYPDDIWHQGYIYTSRTESEAWSFHLVTT